MGTPSTNPSELNRWLNINAVTALERTRGYIVLPAFDVTYEWQGYSELLVAFNFSASNNFSLRGYLVPSNPTFTLAIAWADSNGVVYRYSLWRADSDVIYFNMPAYSGQLIKKNFRLEIWSNEDESTPIVPPVVVGGIIYGEDGEPIYGEGGPIVGESFTTVYSGATAAEDLSIL